MLPLALSGSDLSHFLDIASSLIASVNLLVPSILFLACVFGGQSLRRASVVGYPGTGTFLTNIPLNYDTLRSTKRDDDYLRASIS